MLTFYFLFYHVVIALVLKLVVGTAGYVTAYYIRSCISQSCSMMFCDNDHAPLERIHFSLSICVLHLGPVLKCSYNPFFTRFAFGVDGMMVPFDYAPRDLPPGHFLQQYYCRKHTYALNCQVCNLINRAI
jgi:hypothetical protein